MELMGIPVPDQAVLPAMFAILASFGLFALHPCLVCWNIYKKEPAELHMYTLFACGLYTFLWSTYMVLEDIKHGEAPTSLLHLEILFICAFPQPFYFGAYVFYETCYVGVHGSSVVIGRSLTITIYLVILFLAVFDDTVANNFGVIFAAFGIIMYASPMSLIVSIYRGGDVADYLPSWLCISLLLHSVAWLVLACVLDIDFYFNITHCIGALLSIIQLGAISLLSKKSEHCSAKKKFWRSNGRFYFLTPMISFPYSMASLLSSQFSLLKTNQGQLPVWGERRTSIINRERELDPVRNLGKVSICFNRFLSVSIMGFVGLIASVVWAFGSNNGVDVLPPT